MMYTDPTGHSEVAELSVVQSIALNLMALIVLKTVVSNAYRLLGNAFLSRSGFGQGGPDITRELLGIDRYLTDFRADHGMLPELPVSKSLDQEQWDIRKLAGWGKAPYIGAPGVVSDGMNSFSTVTVDGNVYRPEEVNYYLYGLWFRLNNYDEQYGENRITAYRTFFGPDNGSIIGRIDWFRAGYYGDFSQAAGAIVAHVTPGSAYDGKMYFQIKGGQLNGTVFPNGAVLGGVDAELSN